AASHHLVDSRSGPANAQWLHHFSPRAWRSSPLLPRRPWLLPTSL
ncbi:hypothetical protein, partial [Pseudomonas fluorescens]